MKYKRLSELVLALAGRTVVRWWDCSEVEGGSAGVSRIFSFVSAGVVSFVSLAFETVMMSVVLEACRGIDGEGMDSYVRSDLFS